MNKIDELKASRTSIAEEISRRKRHGQDASGEIAYIREVAERIKMFNAAAREMENV